MHDPTLPSSTDPSSHEVAGSPAHAKVTAEGSAAKAPPSESSTKQPSTRWVESLVPKPGVSLAIFGIFIPLFTLCFELHTRLCASSWFDPLPTWFHVALVALVPVSNFLILLTRWSSATHHRPWLAHLNAIALGVTISYGLAFLPYIPMSVVGLLMVGMGLMPLAPYFAGSATVKARSCLAFWGRRTGEEQVPLPRARYLIVLVVASLALPVLHHAVTLYALGQAATNDPAMQRSAVGFLRVFGSESTMLEACYRSGRFGGIFGDVFQSANDPEKAQETYFRVTGKAFNTLPKPVSAESRGMAGVRGWEFDAARGGDRVANKIAGLTMDYSQLEGRADAATLSSYTEWTMVFKNAGFGAAEARAQIELPVGAVVSRLTLWIDGEPREAAFGGRSQVKGAYREIAVVQQRDPVLVTTCGPDRVLMQCFPVPANNGEMKIRIGITAPLRPTSDKTAAMDWPRLLETNFESAKTLRHVAWIESSAPIDGGSNAFRKELTDAELARAPALRMEIPETSREAIYQDSSDAAYVIRQRLQEIPSAKIGRVHVVLDGSVGMKAHAQSIAQSLAAAPNIASIIFAGDEPLRWDANTPAGSWLSDLKYRGGCDNVPALTQALDEALASPGGSLLWIHGPQPFALSRTEGLSLRLKRIGTNVALHELSIEPGPNRVLEELDSVAEWRRVGEGNQTEEKLSSFFNNRWIVTRERIQKPENATVLPAPNRDLLRLWGRDEIERLRHATAKPDEAVKLAVKLQLVTPVSGAVVLERKEQYDRHGLQPVDAETVPTVPEPTSAALLAIATAGLLARRRRVAQA